jgi:hypothetical protein
MSRAKLKLASTPQLVRPRERAPLDPDRSDHSPALLPKTATQFTEAMGKTVSFIAFINDGMVSQSLEVRFTDGTLFSFELSSRIGIKAEYMEVRRGELEMIREYGIVDTDPEGEGE